MFSQYFWAHNVSNKRIQETKVNILKLGTIFRISPALYWNHVCVFKQPATLLYISISTVRTLDRINTNPNILPCRRFWICREKNPQLGKHMACNSMFLTHHGLVNGNLKA